VTQRARQALSEAEVVLGYKTYLRQAEPLLQGQQVVSSTMTKELERSAQAVELALQGRTAALISSGDPGIYAMAAVVYELVRDRGIVLGSLPGQLRLEVIPGVPAVAAAASLLGAPLSHDFACISLSDRLTPWELIEKRLELAAQADFVIALYNPKSKGRAWQYGRALRIIAGHRPGTTPVGIVTKAMRDDQMVSIMGLAQADQAEVGMQTMVIVGNSQTFTYQGRMVTPRGYLAKYGGQEPGE
jgi:precorrin-3B C17-methyltransferase